MPGAAGRQGRGRVPVKKAARKTAAVARGPWRVPNYAPSTEGDFIEGDDLVARNAAVGALGRLNGSVVVADADSGRILTIVNQKLAYKSGYQPCSTIKVPVALAALSETVIDRLTKIRIYGNTKVAMTEALAKSNNYYFASLGEKLGFERMSYYARLFGLGEKASLNIDRGTTRHPACRDAQERHGHDDQLRRRDHHHAARNGRTDGRGGQRRHAVLPPVSEERSSRPAR